MRVLARGGEVVVASDGVASPSRGFLAIDFFLMAPYPVIDAKQDSTRFHDSCCLRKQQESWNLVMES
jgi:hypothetical protein